MTPTELALRAKLQKLENRIIACEISGEIVGDIYHELMTILREPLNLGPDNRHAQSRETK
jgi:hypothetical protein